MTDTFLQEFSRGNATTDLKPKPETLIEEMDSSELLRTIFDTTPECIKVVARDGRLVRMNAAGLRMVEADSWDRVAGASTSDLIAPEHKAHWLIHHQRVCHGESLVWEFDIIGLRGTRRNMETHAAPIALADGSVAQLAVTRDVTGRQRVQAKLERINTELEVTVAERTLELQSALNRLQESEQRFELLVESVTDYAIYMLDPEGNIISWNAGARRIKGYDAEEIIGKHFSSFYSDEDRASQLPLKGLRTAAEAGRLETEGWRLRKDGTRFWANVTIAAIKIEGQLVGFAKITRDITERRAAEERLRQSQKMEAVGQFTGGAAHDFNNLLMAIMASLELLRKRLPDDPRIVSLLDNAVLGAKRGASLTQRMLAFARRQELKQERVELRQLIEGMDGLLERSLGPMVSLESHFPPSPVYVRTDANQLETALLNLVINARDAMPQGGSLRVYLFTERIRTGHFTSLPAGEYACLSIKDTGGGMDKSTLAKATEPFFTTKGVGKGTGLGLSMVDGLAAQSGGKLTLQSILGEGTTVCVWLPICEPPTGETQRLKDLDVGEAATQSSLHILVLDDDSLVLTNVAAMLEDLGHIAIPASSAARGFELLARHPHIDLVIADQLMPGTTGLQFRDAIKDKHPQLSFILATGYADLAETLDASIRRLNKPYSQQQLANAISLTRPKQGVT